MQSMDEAELTKKRPKTSACRSHQVVPLRRVMVGIEVDECGHLAQRVAVVGTGAGGCIG